MELTRKPFVRTLANPQGRSCIGLVGWVAYYGRVPICWYVEPIGALPPVDQRDELLALLPSWKDLPVGETELRDEA
ncbi:MAG TPA: hypothetical protein VM487_17620 [Phycisphaerae bacterium]|nr:hypothetical protein [Phycisphaerae bacterium]